MPVAACCIISHLKILKILSYVRRGGKGVASYRRAKLGKIQGGIAKIHKYITNISQIYHKYTTKVIQHVILYHKNVILYHKTECFTTKCNILPYSVIFFRNNPTTNCSINYKIYY